MERASILVRRACLGTSWHARLRVIASARLELELVPCIPRASRPKIPYPYTFKERTSQSNMVNTNQKPDKEIEQKQHGVPLEVDVMEGAQQRHVLRQQIFGDESLHSSSLPTTTFPSESYYTFHSSGDEITYQIRHPSNAHERGRIDWNDLPADFRLSFRTPEQIAYSEIHNSRSTVAEPTLRLDELSPDLRSVFTSTQPTSVSPHCDSPPNLSGSLPSKRSTRRQQRFAQNKETRKNSRERANTENTEHSASSYSSERANTNEVPASQPLSGMSAPSNDPTSQKSPPAQHKPLVVGRTKPKSTSTSSMENSSAVDGATSAMAKADLNKEIEKNVSTNTAAAAPAESTDTQPTKKKEKAPKQPKAPKPTPAATPLSPAIIDLRVGHILRAINHPNADSLYVSTIAMGDPEGTDHTQVDEETGKVVRTVCSGLNGLVPLAEMQDRKVVVVANLKPVNMRSIKSAAMVLAASPPAEEGADPHAADRVVELVTPPEGSEAGDSVYFEGWPYGEGKGPEKQLNPKKKQWEAIQPGFFTSEDLMVGFDAGKSEVDGAEKGMLIVEGKGKCTVKTLKGAVVR